MNVRRIGFIGALLTLLLTLAACSTASTVTPATGNAPGTTTTSAGASPFASPSASSGSVATASPGTSSGQVTTLKQAVANLQNLDSYVMTVKVQNVSGNLATLTGSASGATLKIVRNGEDRELTVTSANGDHTFRLWHVNGAVYADIGNGATKISDSNNMLAQIVANYGSNENLFGSVTTEQANWEVVGTDEVNGQQTTVETSSYQLRSRAGNNFLFGDTEGVLTSRIWVAQDGNYLMKADFMLDSSGAANASSTAIAGTPISGNAAATGNVDVAVELSQVNSAPQIKAPSS